MMFKFLWFNSKQKEMVFVFCSHQSYFYFFRDENADEIGDDLNDSQAVDFNIMPKTHLCTSSNEFEDEMGNRTITNPTDMSLSMNETDPLLGM